MARVTALISRGLAAWALLGAAAAYAWPQAFAWTAWPLLGQPVAIWMFALTMFAVGTVIDPASFGFLRRRPSSIVLGLATQFTVMPTLAYTAAKFGGFDDDIALGFIIVGCAPGAMTSNVLTYMAKGDTAYSVTLTTLGSILAVVLTPTLVALLAGAEMGVTAADFWSQLWTIAWTVATPLLLGLGVRVAFPGGRRIYEAVSPAVAVVAIVVICCFVIQGARDRLAPAALGGGVFAWVVLLNALGFALGALLAGVYRLERPQRITLSIEVGMQNAGMGVVLATRTFPDRPAVAIPAALFTIWCILTAAGLIAVLRRRNAAAGA